MERVNVKVMRWVFNKKVMGFKQHTIGAPIIPHEHYFFVYVKMYV